MLCRIGGSVPLVLTELETILLLVFIGAFARMHTFRGALYFLLGVVIAIGLGFSLLSMFSRLWAMAIAAAMSLLWLGLGVQTWYDAGAHPEKYRFGDGAEAVIFLVPFGFIGVVSWAIIFWDEWLLRQYSPSAADNRAELRIVP
jgi:hypothetical protein